MRERIWVTGAGLITALGANSTATWSRLLAGDVGIGPLSLFPADGLRSQVAAEVGGVEVMSEPAAHARGQQIEAWSRTSVMALRAAREALADAQVEPPTMSPPGGPRVGLVVGGTAGGMFETERLLADLYSEPHANDALLRMLSHPLSATAQRLIETLGPFDRQRTVCSACSSGAIALVVGAMWLLRGTVDVVLAGGSDALCRLTFTGFNALAAMDSAPCRPFDKRRAGLSLGEGAGFVVLERARDARARRKVPYCELSGWALGAEAHHITNPDASGTTAARLMSGAMRMAGLRPSDVDYVNAHGTGTPLNDAMEARAIHATFGAEAERVLVSSSKSQLGHTLGAAGAIEAAVSANVLLHQRVVPTAGLTEPDTDFPLAHVFTSRPAKVRSVLSNSFGFGGMDAVLAFSRPDTAPLAERARASVVVSGIAAITSEASVQGAAAVGALPDVRGEQAVADFDGALDPSRSRRMDRPARLITAVAAKAVADAGMGVSDDAVGIVFGSAFGSVDASASFMHRLFEKGPRLASPAEFPNLVPSSPVGHASIYLGAKGPVLATADLGTSGESAIAQAIELVENGEARAIVAGGAEERSNIVERVLGAMFATGSLDGASLRSEGAAALVLESADRCTGRGHAPIARILGWCEWQGPDLPAILGTPGDASIVVTHMRTAALDRMLARSAWAAVAVHEVQKHSGSHEAGGAIALASAVAFVGQGRVGRALAIGLSHDRGYGFVLERP
jgi:3-oxoacyl-[acyl-carrier-protein] synthase II